MPCSDAISSRQVPWLRRGQSRRALKRGDYITTGSVTAPIPVEPGQHVVADFGPLGRIELHVGAP